ncbi:hypothetical protein LPA44_17260 [Halobacterium sp. KA-4]|uniref:hypothetical protein n=1 Tax=Halobacterium sp. KA-4 TaxID=2896367 RepID=UPI001E479C4F|nr:hypothetical protein [Halobacterium sp. KA-4]MCD2201612.1 hypothetical protein [Halobacterium sp. KA-4]
MSLSDGAYPRPERRGIAPAPRINTPEPSGHQTTGQDATAQRDEKTANPQSATQATHEPAPQTAQEPDETDPDDASGSDTQGEADSAASPAQVSPDQLYTDETGATYVETALGPDKRLHVDSDGQHYYQRGQAMRAVSGGFAILCAGFALFAFFILPGLAGGPNAPRGRILFALVEAIPFGNVIVGLLAIWIGYHLAYIAYTGREYMNVDNPD